jgi:protein-export membrane protein SecD
MSRGKYVIISLFFVFLGIALGILVYPNYLNKKIDFLNSKFNWHLPKAGEVPFKLGLDLKGGVELLYEADLSQIEKKDYSQAMEGLKEVIERRINVFGVREPEIQVQSGGGHFRLSVKLPGIKDPKEAIKEIGKTPYLEFKEERQKEEREKIIREKLGDQAQKQEIDVERLCSSGDFIASFIKVYGQDPCFKETTLTGRYLKRAELAFEPRTYEPMVSLQFNKEGAKIFEDLTARNVGRPLAIYIDNVLISAPRVQERISGGRAQITGKFTVKEAKNLATNLNAGALPVPINLISQKTIGPTLGLISLKESLKAGIIGFLAIIVFLIIFYRFSGLLGVFALLIYLSILLALFKFMPVTLTLAGIGGFILSIGMAVDANILIFSRLKEELDEGKDFSQAVEEGFRRAWPSIRDGNLTTLIAALILFGIGSGFVKGFATTLSLGIFVSVFAAMVVTKSFMKSFSQTKLEKIKWLWK